MDIRINKYLIGSIALTTLLLVVAATVSYRAHMTGLSHIGFLKEGNAYDREDEVLTRVLYLQPFASAQEVSRAIRQEQNLVAQAITALDAGIETLLGLDLFDDRPLFKSEAPEFETIESEGGEATLRVSEEGFIDRSEDRRALGYSGQRKVLSDSDGNVLIAYRRRYEGKYQIFVSELMRQSESYVLLQSIDPVSFSTLGITQRVPSIALDGKDDLHIVWYGSDTPEYPNRRQIFHSNTKSSKNFWEAEDTITYVQGYESEFERWQEHPTVEVINYDEILVAWEGKDESYANQQIKFSRSLDGGSTWDEWSNVRPDRNHTFSRPTLLFVPQTATLYMFAYSSHETGGGQQIQYTYSNNHGITWSDWEVVSPGEYDARHVSATLVGNTPLIAYRTPMSENGPSQIMYQTVTTDDISPAIPFHPTDNYQFFPSVMALPGSDRFCISWIEEDTSSEFPTEDPTDGDIYFGCNTLSTTGEESVFNLTPTGSHLYPNLPRVARDPSRVPIVYYDDEEDEIIIRFIDLTA